MNPEEIFSQAWDILVQHAGASKDHLDKGTFVRAFLEPQHSATEWRFCGHLGFGGKFWRNDQRYYISCYPEDRTERRLAIIETVNGLLASLPYFHPQESRR